MAVAPRKKEILRAFDKFLEDGSYERNLVSMGLKVVVEELTDPLFLVGEAIWCVLKKALQGTMHGENVSCCFEPQSETLVGAGLRERHLNQLSADRAMGLEVDRIAGQ